MSKLRATAHAICRYMERSDDDLAGILGLARMEASGGSNQVATDGQVVQVFQRTRKGREAIDEISRRLTEPAQAIYDALGDGRYPASGGYVQIQDGKVITFRKRKW